MNITIITPEGEESNYTFNSDEVVIGRGQNCDVVITDDHISRQHLQVKKFDGIIFLKDLTLSNWISYNEEKLEKGVDVQYFDFAPLVLPGNYNVKISDDEVYIDNESKSEIKGIDIFNSELANYVDDDEEDENTDKKKSKKTQKGKKWKPTRKLKKRNDPAIMSLVVFVVFAFVVYQFFFKDQYEEQKNQEKLEQLKPTPRPTNQKRILRRRTQLNQATTNSNAAASTGNAEMPNQQSPQGTNDIYQEVLASDTKCQSELLKPVCSTIFPVMSKREGLLRIDNTLYVVKNLSVRGTQLLRSRDNFLGTKIGQDQLKKIIAGEGVLLPNFLKMMELNNIDKIIVVLFEMSRLQTTIVSKYEITVSDYRKYDQDKYTKAYSAIVAEQDSNQFESNLMSYIRDL